MENSSYLTAGKLERALAGSEFQSRLKTVLKNVDNGHGSFKLFFEDGKIIYPSRAYFYDKLTGDEDWGEYNAPDPKRTMIFPGVNSSECANEFCSPVLLDIWVSPRGLSQAHLEYLNNYRVNSEGSKGLVIRPIGLVIQNFNNQESNSATLYQENTPKPLTRDKLEGSYNHEAISLMGAISNAGKLPTVTLERALESLPDGEADPSKSPVEMAEGNIRFIEGLKKYAEGVSQEFPYHRIKRGIFDSKGFGFTDGESDLDEWIHYD